MSIADFNPLTALGGGLLIGAATALILWSLGRVTGVSGMLESVLRPGSGDRWQLAFLAGLVLGGGLYALAVAPIAVRLQAAWPAMLGAGLLVGAGTKVGGGCTSGHGVCGIARGSARSIAATLVFMATAAVVVFLVRHVFGAPS